VKNSLLAVEPVLARARRRKDRADVRGLIFKAMTASPAGARDFCRAMGKDLPIAGTPRRPSGAG